jgi:putative ABC transport system permease protein
VLKFLKLAIRDLRHQPEFVVLFVANLALGLTGAMTLDGLQGSIERTLEARSRSFLGADLRISSNRPLTSGEQERLHEVAIAKTRGEAAVASARLVQLYSMVSAGEVSRLTEIRAIDGVFPLRGNIELSGGEPVDGRRRNSLVEDRAAWSDPALLDQLGVGSGATVRIGGAEFVVTDTIERDTGLSVRATSLAPRLYVSRVHLEATNLIQRGSRVEYQSLFAFPDGADAREIAARMRTLVDDPRVRIASHDEAIEEISGGYRRVTRYLGLVSLVALALAGVSCAYLFRAFLRNRLVDLAVMMSVGASRHRAQSLLFVELSLLGVCAAILATGLTAVLLPLASRLLSDFLPAQVELSLAWRETLPTLTVALLVGPLCCLPLLGRLRSLRISELFQEHARLDLAKGSNEVLRYIPALGLLAALAVARTGEFRQSLTFVASLVVAFAVTAFFGRCVLLFLSRARKLRSVPLRLALRQLSPHRRASLTAFVAVAMCALLLSLPPQLRAVLDARLRPPAPDDIPSLFMFDIQPEQADRLAEHVTGAGSRLQRMAPMIRARLDAINGEPIAVSGVTNTAADFRDQRRLRSRRYNLTYQSELASTERLVAGRPFSGVYAFDSGEPGEMSMEVDFARRLGVGLGDTLTFDIQGVPVEGRIVNLRAVDWNSMQPNFFVSFQPGVLEAAPAVFLASTPALPAEMRNRLQASIAEAFPNVSMIDVSRGVDRLLSLLDQLQWAITATALLSLIVGIVLVFAIARDEAQSRRWDFNMLKVLGADHGTVRRSIDTEFAVLGFGAASLGCATAVLVCAVLAARVLDAGWSPAWVPLLAIVLAIPLVSVGAGRLAMRGVLADRPLAFLR